MEWSVVLRPCIQTGGIKTSRIEHLKNASEPVKASPIEWTQLNPYAVTKMADLMKFLQTDFDDLASFCVNRLGGIQNLGVFSLLNWTKWCHSHISQPSCYVNTNSTTKCF